MRQDFIRSLRHFWFIYLLVLSGCAALGLQPATSFDQRLAYSYGVNTAIREASTSALNAGTITKNDMETVISLNNQVRQVLDAARAASSVGDIKTAEAKLLLASEILEQLQGYLRSKGVKTSMIGELKWA